MAASDASHWAEFALLPEVQRLTSSAERSVADLVAVIERTLSTEAQAPVLFSVREAASERLVAVVGFHTVSAVNRTAEVSYTVRPECRGQGLATLLCAAAVRWGFAQRGWVRIQATTLTEHAASQRVLLKCGFEFEGRLRNFRTVRGVPSDYFIYSTVPPGP